MADLERQHRSLGVGELDLHPILNVDGGHPPAIDVHPVEAAVVDGNPAPVVEPQNQMFTRNQGVGNAHVGSDVAPDDDVVAGRERARRSVVPNSQRGRGWSAHRRLPGASLHNWRWHSFDGCCHGRLALKVFGISRNSAAGPKSTFSPAPWLLSSLRLEHRSDDSASRKRGRSADVRGGRDRAVRGLASLFRCLSGPLPSWRLLVRRPRLPRPVVVSGPIVVPVVVVPVGAPVAAMPVAVDIAVPVVVAHEPLPVETPTGIPKIAGAPVIQRGRDGRGVRDATGHSQACEVQRRLTSARRLMHARFVPSYFFPCYVVCLRAAAAVSFCKSAAPRETRCRLQSRIVRSGRRWAATGLPVCRRAPEPRLRQDESARRRQPCSRRLCRWECSG